MGILGKWLESLDYEYQILSSCTRHLSPRSTCHKCVNACNEKAISLEKGKPVLERSKCTECGNCISACPVQAIAGIYPKRKIVQNQLVIKEDSIPTVKELLIFYQKGIKTIVAETQVLLESWKPSIDEANGILQILGEGPFLVETKSIAAETYVSRRELFFLWKREGKSALKEIAPAKWQFNHQDIDLAKYYRDVQFTKIKLNRGKCTLCHVCQRLCVKKCFAIHEERFVLSSQGCENCQLCVDTCPEKALDVEDCISKVEETSLPIYKKICSRCHNPFQTLREYDEKCVVCTKQERMSKLLKRV